jgi:hypothetical protein
MAYRISIYCLVLSVVLLLFSSCNSCNNTQKVIQKKVATIPLTLDIVRFDQLVFDTTQNFDNLSNKYSNFWTIYCERILRIKQPNDSVQYKKSLQDFVSNRYIKGLHDTVQVHFSNFEPFIDQLTNAFKYYKYYFPKTPTPTVYTFISEFGYGAIISDSLVGIGLDMFLGENYPYYSSPQINFPSFFIKKCVPQNLCLVAIKAWLNGNNTYNTSKRKLIDLMIQQGKEMYVCTQVMPALPDSILLGYSNNQIKWCNWNEFKIWEYFIKNDLLYKTDRIEISKFITDGPVTPGMPPESPGNMGAWIGLQIVKKYMQANQQITLEQLMAETDGQKIMEQSKYKPTYNK